MRPVVVIFAAAGWATASVLALRLLDARHPAPGIQPPCPRDGWVPQPKPRWPDTPWDIEQWHRSWWKHLPCGVVTAGRPDECPRCTSQAPHPSTMPKGVHR